MLGKYCLESTNDKTDRTPEVTELLEKYGVCHFGVGDFYINNLVMPEMSMIAGCGNATRLILDENIEDGFIISMKTACTVKDVRLVGSTEPIVPEETLGKRHGIVWKGNYKDDRNDFPVRATVEGLYIHGFSGGGITHDNTGYAVISGINVSNCFIWNCGAGINIHYWSEFNRYTNVASSKNYYGLINNGGNNVFVNCCFSSNTLGVLMDNMYNQSPNNSHGDMIGCTIDHSGNNEGLGIKILNMKVGYYFTSCQLMYSGIELVDCDGIVFDGLNMKNESISVKGGGTVIFTNCLSKFPPVVTVEDNPNVRFINCFTREGEPF